MIKKRPAHLYRGIASSRRAAHCSPPSDYILCRESSLLGEWRSTQSRGAASISRAPSLRKSAREQEARATTEPGQHGKRGAFRGKSERKVAKRDIGIASARARASRYRAGDNRASPCHPPPPPISRPHRPAHAHITARCSRGTKETRAGNAEMRAGPAYRVRCVPLSGRINAHHATLICLRLPGWPRGVGDRPSVYPRPLRRAPSPVLSHCGMLLFCPRARARYGCARRVRFFVFETLARGRPLGLPPTVYFPWGSGQKGYRV